MARGNNATLTTQAASTTTTLLLGGNTERKAFKVVNDGTANLYLAYGPTASTTIYTVKLIPNAYYEGNVALDGYTGPVSAIWDAATGNARVTEVT